MNYSYVSKLGKFLDMKKRSLNSKDMSIVKQTLVRWHVPYEPSTEAANRPLDVSVHRIEL